MSLPLVPQICTEELWVTMVKIRVPQVKRYPQ